MASFLPSTQTLQSPNPSFRPSLPSSLALSPRCSSIPPSNNSHAFPSAKVSSSKLMGPSPKGPFGVTRRNNVSAGASNSQYSPSIADDLGDVTIFTAAGERVAFNDLWDQNEVSVAYIHIHI